MNDEETKAQAFQIAVALEIATRQANSETLDQKQVLEAALNRVSDVHWHLVHAITSPLVKW